MKRLCLDEVQLRIFMDMLKKRREMPQLQIKIRWVHEKSSQIDVTLVHEDWKVGKRRQGDLSS